MVWKPARSIGGIAGFCRSSPQTERIRRYPTAPRNRRKPLCEAVNPLLEPNPRITLCGPPKHLEPQNGARLWVAVAEDCGGFVFGTQGGQVTDWKPGMRDLASSAVPDCRITLPVGSRTVYPTGSRG